VSVAGAVVRDDGKVLCIRRQDNGHWEPPGGVLELGERIHDGLIREVREETGLIVAPGPLTGVYQNQPRNIVALVFRCLPVSGNLQTSDETAELDWLDRAQFEERMSQAYAIRLVDALEYVDTAAVRTHDGRFLLTSPRD
jgi:ADP-ribose pyrophosphatase YjhB (NUDIX family)